ncbi:MAG: MgtC/SapB family protein [Oscillospiraceae bacterium]|nr:MgtC/SapB family protein [Oscillospiraceae bacterium]MBR3474621.1 MgtC/SapB family protein [Oscillospiraceae bacterium]
MLSGLNFVREMSFLAVTVRMLSAVFCGGFIGLEREFKRRPAGFRTHILIALGAAITMLTNLYLYQVMHLYTDISRLGAQAIAGIGFIGAGTIIVTKRHRVKGLTTAAGLWTAAIIGLVCGAGYLELAFFTTALVLIAELLLVRLEYYLKTKAEQAHLYVEYRKAAAIERILAMLKEKGFSVSDLEISRSADESEGPLFSAVLALQIHRTQTVDELVLDLQRLEDVTKVEET